MSGIGVDERSASSCLRHALVGSRGFTLVELVVVVTIVAILTLIAAPVYTEITDKAKIAKAIADIKILEAEITAYEGLNGALPTSLVELQHPRLTDPWGSPYEYVNFAALGPSANGRSRKDRFLVPLNTTFDLYSKGKDGESRAPLTARESRDDIVRANDGGFVGLASEF